MIVWDLGDVVAHFDPERRLTALEQHTGLPRRHIEDKIWCSGLDAAAEQGELADEEVWRQTLEALDDRISRDTLRACWSMAFVPDRAVLDLIDQLPTPAALLTDNGPILEACLRDELHDIGIRFNELLLSCRLGATKRSALDDDGAVFGRAAATIGIDPNDLTLIDDRQANVTAARRAGWHAIVFTSVRDLADQLS